SRGGSRGVAGHRLTLGPAGAPRPREARIHVFGQPSGVSWPLLHFCHDGGTNASSPELGHGSASAVASRPPQLRARRRKPDPTGAGEAGTRRDLLGASQAEASAVFAKPAAAVRPSRGSLASPDRHAPAATRATRPARGGEPVESA